MSASETRLWGRTYDEWRALEVECRDLKREVKRLQGEPGYLVKLVRDDIPATLGGPGIVTYRPMPQGEHIQRLRAKLVEEAAEYAVSPTIEELADIYEVLLALAKVAHGHGWGEVVDTAERKRAARGGFDRGIGMYAKHPSDGDEDD